MAKQSGLGDNLLVGGYNLSGDINSVSGLSGGPALTENTGIDKLAVERIGLLRDGKVDFVSFFNTTAGQAFPVLKVLPTTDVMITYLRGTALGAPCANLIAKQTNYDATRGADGQITFTTSAVGQGYGLEWGIQLTAGLRTDTAATNGTGLDDSILSASTAFGGQAFLQVSSVVGTSVTVAVQDSADNVSFANVTGLAFTAVTPGGAPSTQRLAIGNTATIRRYVRVATTGTFTSAVFSVGLTRNETAGIVF